MLVFLVEIQKGKLCKDKFEANLLAISAVSAWIIIYTLNVQKAAALRSRLSSEWLNMCVCVSVGSTSASGSAM